MKKLLLGVILALCTSSLVMASSVPVNTAVSKTMATSNYVSQPISAVKQGAQGPIKTLPPLKK